MKLINKRTLFIVVTLMLVSCQSSWRQPFPDTEIVYQAKFSSENLIGFVNSDGSSPIVLIVGDYFRKPSWSPDGSIIYGLTDSPAADIGNPSFWNNNGGFNNCKEWGFWGGVVWSGNKDNLKEVFVSDSQSILLVDLEQCKQIKEIVNYWENSDIPVNGIYGISLSPDQKELLFAIEEYDYLENTHEYPIRKINLDDGSITKLAEGISPSWSPDGSQITYLQPDGIYIMMADGTLSSLLLEHKFGDPYYGNFGLLVPAPKWSPNGEWIIYHRCEEYDCRVGENTIYKVNVNTGQESEIVSGGIYPSWKP